MYLLVNVLEQPEHLVAILEGFAKMGIKGSTVMNSTGMGRVLMIIDPLLMSYHFSFGVRMKFQSSFNSGASKSSFQFAE